MRVLVAEDQSSMLCALQRCLKEQGFWVDVASDETEVADKVRSVRYDLIVLSLALGGDGGLRLLRTWRQAGVRCPVLALASAAGPDERARCLDLEADECLCRPFKLEEFRAQAAALVRRVYGVTTSLVRVRDLEIDTTTQTVRRSGRMVHLTRSEYTLLQLLAFHRGEVVSKSVMWEHLYGEHRETHSNVVNAFIRSLRRKIDEGADVPLILTRYGRGFLLRGEDNEPDRRTPATTDTTPTSPTWPAAASTT
jgi:DNA-binding response OmpR family regulator